jgi:response regulator RpfG family c-di-GMP phosphodiesterase
LSSLRRDKNFAKLMNHIQDFSENLSVLIIEDNLGDFVLIEDYLLEKFKQINIITRIIQIQSITYNSTEQISVILLDLHLPDRKVELINGILSCFRIPIIILTGYSDLTIAKKSLQIGRLLNKNEINTIKLLNRNSFVNQIEDENLITKTF